MIYKIRHIYKEFPLPFWTLIAASFVDRLGGVLTDRVGKRLIIIVGLVANGLTSLAMIGTLGLHLVLQREWQPLVRESAVGTVQTRC